ncbi:zinc finger protein CONSTANS-LIKE 2 [Malania oleifera]|uniref:zinc finger protein CONSTANS-LIKE 2 n=1 Tax=Malania oleifera TaxID=397392 RepID=UPI0025ADB667|nr:zinc finger protein CONSTANS-LIKE 2 [Malania oleifera]
MKGCELCRFPARMFCEADQASLCWDCDEKVHRANFLVARHSRCLLCHVCQAPTPWTAAGAKLGPTISVCERCSTKWNGGLESGGRSDEGNDVYNDGGEEEDEDEDDDGDGDGGGDDDDGDDCDEEEEDEDGENQVVPLSISTTPPPSASSSSSEEDSSCGFSRAGGGGVSSFKRIRENAHLDSDDDIGCSSSLRNHNATSMAMAHKASSDDEATSLSSLRPSKQRRINDQSRSENHRNRDEAESTPTAIISSLKRLQERRIADDDDASATIVGIRTLSRDPTAVDLLPTDSTVHDRTA